MQPPCEAEPPRTLDPPTYSEIVLKEYEGLSEEEAREKWEADKRRKIDELTAKRDAEHRANEATDVAKGMLGPIVRIGNEWHVLWFPWG
jgi:hypothetical protein